MRLGLGLGLGRPRKRKKRKEHSLYIQPRASPPDHHPPARLLICPATIDTGGGTLGAPFGDTL